MVSHHHNCLYPQQNEVATFVADLSVMTIWKTHFRYNIRSLKNLKALCTLEKDIPSL